MKKISGFESKSEHLKVTCNDFNKFGITYFSYILLTEGKIINDVFSNAEWGNYYKKNHYVKRDPLVKGILSSNSSLIIWEALHLFGEERKVMLERNEICGIKSGLTIGIQNNGETEVIALGTEMTSQDFYFLLNDDKYFKNIHRITQEFYSNHKAFEQKNNPLV